jgi:hypothetical protein
LSMYASGGFCVSSGPITPSSTASGVCKC